MSYAIDGKCHNSEPGWCGQECGRPAVWTAESASGFRSGFCVRCRATGSEARGMHGWQPYDLAREVLIAVNRNHRSAEGFIDTGAMSKLFETYAVPVADRTRIWCELTAATAFNRADVPS